MTTHSIYALCDPDTGDVRYIGRTLGSVAYRLASHLTEAKRVKVSSRPVVRWMQSLAENDQLPRVMLLEKCEDGYEVERESAWIATYSQNNLLNAIGVILPTPPKKTPFSSLTRDFLKDFIAQRGLTQVQVARDLGYSEEHLNRVINGKEDMSNSFRWRFLEVYGITAMSALNGDEAHP